MVLQPIADGVWTAESELRLPPGVRMPIRMTLLEVARGELLLHSPIAIDRETWMQIGRLGRVRHVLAPNLLHHLYVAPALAAFPGARLYAPPGFALKQPELTVERTLDGAAVPELEGAVQLELVGGAPKLNEVVVLHEPSGTLIVTDLVFNVVEPRGFGAHAVLWAAGCHGRLAQSRALRFMIRDRVAAAASARRILDWQYERVVPAHGEVITEAARERLGAALARMAAAADTAAPLAGKPSAA